MKHKAGFVNIIGSPNVGKSTLINQLIGEQLAIISPKAQTTRHRILAIKNHDDYQIVFSDTPGIIDPAYKLQEGMMKMVRESLEDADIILLMVESGQKRLPDHKFIDKVKQADIPVILLINKVDQSDQNALGEQIEHWANEFEGIEILPISALHNFNIDLLEKRILELLPEHPAFYPKTDYTDRSERFIVEEKIREKILLNFKQEVPYSVEIKVEEFKEEEDIIRIRAVIHTARESQRGILIGKGGKMIKLIGKESRIDLEKFFDKKIFLDLHIKVKKDWRDDESQLKRFGYL
ncbi:MAG: GTPase Era [Flavobacteriales bacterium]|nr:GTPase Era [Flavobacteriales bacterium]